MVELGRTLEVSRHMVTAHDVLRDGYNSVSIRGFDVFAVYDPRRVRIIEFQRAGQNRWFRSMAALLRQEHDEARSARLYQQMRNPIHSVQERRSPQVKSSFVTALNFLWRSVFAPALVVFALWGTECWTSSILLLGLAGLCVE